ncbi:MAG TPA: molybdate ABC transporter substrate-binding protein, partial [Gemmataceae bacterium]|nr:molybdate ABC transporter substrate-binding protein [Gemmataceae bacterium]
MRIAVVVIAGLFAVGCGGGPVSPRSQTVRVAAAADLKFAFDELSAAFRKEHPQFKVEVVYGSSGNFFAQLSEGAPFDLFLSANMDYPKKLVEQGRGVPGSVFVYAVGHLVVWVPKASPLDLEKLGIRATAEPAVRKLALANPRHAPYGQAAEAALKRAGIYEQVKDRLVFGENVAQTAQMVDTGAADVGLIALSLAVAAPLRDHGRYFEVDADLYPP